MALRITLAGSTGWVGKALVAAIAASDDLELAGAVSRSAAGQDAGEAAGLPRLGVHGQRHAWKRLWRALPTW